MSPFKYHINLAQPSKLDSRPIDNKDHIRFIISYSCLVLLCILAAYISSNFYSVWSLKEKEKTLLLNLDDYAVRNASADFNLSYPLLKSIHYSQVNRSFFPINIVQLRDYFKQEVEIESIQFNRDSLIIKGAPKSFPLNKAKLDEKVASIYSWKAFRYNFNSLSLHILDNRQLKLIALKS